jgi:ketosteroid isomerase-like protein
MRFELALIAALAACSAELVERPENTAIDRASLTPKATIDAGPVVATQLEMQIATRYLAALSSPTFDGLAKLVDDDATFIYVDTKNNAHGRNDVLASHQALFGEIEPRTFAPTRVLVTDRNQVIEWTLEGKDKTSKKPIGFRGVTLVDTKDDGTIRSIRVFFDEALFRAQRGQEPKVLAGVALPKLPTGPPEIVVQTQSATEGKNVRVVADWLDALENNQTKYAAAMTADVEVQTQELSKPTKGAIDAYYAQMHKVFGNTLDTQWAIGWGIGDYVVVDYRIVGDMRGRLGVGGWVPAKNGPVTLFVVDVIHLTNGKIDSVARYDDPGQILWP